MKLKYNFVTNQVADKIVAVAVGEDLNKFGGFIKMNKTGETIFNLLKNEITFEEIVSEMAKIYPDATVDEITESVEIFVNEMKKSDVIE